MKGVLASLLQVVESNGVVASRYRLCGIGESCTSATCSQVVAASAAPGAHEWFRRLLRSNTL
jgi:hypothetical protein